jgi:hypothetical protein
VEDNGLQRTGLFAKIHTGPPRFLRAVDFFARRRAAGGFWGFSRDSENRKTKSLSFSDRPLKESINLIFFAVSIIEISLKVL